MLSSVAAFLQDRSVAASIAYSFLFIFYYGFLVALSVLLAVKSPFPLRGRMMAGLIVLYTITNLTGEALSDSVAKARMATNASTLRLFIVMFALGILFSILMSAFTIIGRRKK